MSAIRSAADEAHRDDTRKRTHEAHLDRVKKGYWVGGRVFGYRNVNVFNGVDRDGRPLKVGVVLEINEEERVVVIRIFEMYAEGLGLKAIAKTLTRENAARPIPQKREDGLAPVRGWSPSTVRSVLNRELYHGVHVWNETKKRDDWGQKYNRRHFKPTTDVVRVPLPHLRIVSEELWNRVASRRADIEGRAVRFGSGRISGRPPKNAVKNLLAGLATCGLCGGGLIVETSARKGHRVAEYICNSHRRNGSCTNALRVAAEVMNEAVLQAIEEHALTPEAIENVIQLSERDDVQDSERLLNRELKDIDKRLKRLVEAIEDGAAPAAILNKISEFEERKIAIQEELKNLKPIPRLEPKVIENRLAEWRRLLRASTTQGRAVLQRVLRGRIIFHLIEGPEGAGYTFEAPTRFDKLFSGIVAPKPAFLKEGDRRGAEHIGPEDTFDGDYGKLLERVQNRKVNTDKEKAGNGKGMASPRRVNPFSNQKLFHGAVAA